MAGGVTGQFEDALNRKYDIQQSEATARAGLYGAQSQGILGSLPTENAVRAAQANETNQRAATIAPLAQSTIAQGQAQIGEAGARSRLIGSQATGQDISNSPVSESVLRALHSSFLGNGLFGGGGGVGFSGANTQSSVLSQPTLPSTPSSGVTQIPPTAGDQTGENPYGFSAGTAKVPGKGSSKVDTVPAMLAPREAVLNEHAADLIGRDKIAAANAIGNAVGKGMPPSTGQTTAQQPEPRAYAKGTAKVAAYYPKGKQPMKPQGLAKGTENVQTQPVERGHTPTIQFDTGQPQRPGALTPQPQGIANILAMMQGVQKPQKFAKGSHMVAPGKSAKTPKLDPQSLAAAMQMMGGMGGQPGMAPAAPMPGKGMS